MTEDYAEYLQSDGWKQKRQQRLSIGKFRCSACADKKAVHVHHLTYARIFNEDMADLLPLCESHHRTAEELIKNGRLPRHGDVLFLATETIRLILVQRPKKDSKFKKRVAGVETRNAVQEKLLQEEWFLDLLKWSRSRKDFKRALKKQHRSSRVLTNAFVLWDRMKSHNATLVKSVSISHGAASLNGFAPPKRVWTQCSEADRHEAALTRINGF